MEESRWPMTLEEVRRRIVRLQIIGAPGAILIGLALYALFGAEGEPFHPLLADRTIVIGMLAVGIALEIWQLTRLIPLFRMQARLQRGQSL